MADDVSLTVNGRAVSLPAGSTVSAAVMIAGHASFRTSVTGQPRGPLCGMGVCFECRVKVDGEEHVRSCQLLCREGMEVSTDD